MEEKLNAADRKVASSEADRDEASPLHGVNAGVVGWKVLIVEIFFAVSTASALVFLRGGELQDVVLGIGIALVCSIFYGLRLNGLSRDALGALRATLEGRSKDSRYAETRLRYMARTSWRVSLFWNIAWMLTWGCTALLIGRPAKFWAIPLLWGGLCELVLGSLLWLRLHVLADVLLIAARGLGGQVEHMDERTRWARMADQINRAIPHTLIPVALMGAYVFINAHFYLALVERANVALVERADLALKDNASPALEDMAKKVETLQSELAAAKWPMYIGVIGGFVFTCAILSLHDRVFFSIKERTLLDHALPAPVFGNPLTRNNFLGLPSLMGSLLARNPIRAAQTRSTLDLMLGTQHWVGHDVLRALDRLDEAARRYPHLPYGAKKEINDLLVGLHTACEDAELSVRRARDSTRLGPAPKERVDLAALASEIGRAPRFDGRVEVRGDAPLWVSGDAVALRDALESLVENADIAQRPTESRERVSQPVLVTLGHHGADATVTITDHGTGFRADVLKRHPEPLNTSFSRPFLWERRLCGLGLGLYVVDHIARMHGGRLVLPRPRQDTDSVPEATVVWLHLPRRQEDVEG